MLEIQRVYDGTRHTHTQTHTQRERERERNAAGTLVFGIGSPCTMAAALYLKLLRNPSVFLV